MKKHLIPVLASLFLTSQIHAQKRWDGGGDGLSWIDPANWNDDAIPLPSEDVILDNTILFSSYTVTLPAGDIAVSVNSLVMAPSQSFQILLLVPAANTSAAAFTATGPGDAIILNAGAVLKNASGASSGTPVSVTATNFFRINNGGHYIHNTARGHTNFLASRLSTAAGTEFGIFELDVPGSAYTLSLSGRHFGTLILSSTAHGAPVTYSGGGINDLHVHGNLVLGAGTRFSSSLAADLLVNGDLVLMDDSQCNIQSSVSNNRLAIGGHIEAMGAITKTGSGLPKLELNGNTNQDILISSLLSGIPFRMNNPAGVTLMAPLDLPGDMELANGKIHTSAINLLTMGEGSQYTGGGPESFVEGPMKKIGAGGFRFPIGAGAIYAPLELINANGESTADAFTATYIRANPQATTPYIYDHPGIDHISYVEYWTIEQNAGSSVKNVLIPVHELSFVEDIAQTYICRYDINRWVPEPSLSTQTGNAGNSQTGYITTTSGVNRFQAFSFGTDLPESINPLPVGLVYFTAERVGDHVFLRWRTAGCCAGYDRFEILRSADTRNFIPIGEVPAVNNNADYHFADPATGNVRCFYRLRMSGADNRGAYSNTVFVTDEPGRLWLGSVVPNPSGDEAWISLSSPETTTIQLNIFNITGSLVRQFRTPVLKGANKLELPVAGLPAGNYLLMSADRSDQSNIVRFVKL